jgi:CRP-like cAMP-binding protein
MSQANLIDEMRQCEFFRGFETDHLRRLANIAWIEEFAERSTVFEEYERASHVYVILSGQISLAICEPADACKQIAVVQPGELMGWSALVGRPRLYDSAHTTTKVKVLVFNGDELMAYCQSNPAFGFKFMHRVACTLAERLSGTRLQMLDLCGVHLPEFPPESD